MTVRRAALVYGIPKSTLHDRVSGKVNHEARVGAPKYLTDEEEEEVVKWLEGCAQVGCAKSVKDVRAIVGAIVAKKQGVDCVVVSHGWWDRFRQRHPHLALRAGEALAYQRAVATSPETLKNYFDQLEEVLEQNNLRNSPSLIFNADESGMPLQYHVGKRIAVKGQKHVNVITSGRKVQITVLACVSASGYSLPPMIVFKRKGLTEELIRGEVPDTIYGLSESGWMDGELFSQWFRYHFLKYAPSSRPIILLLDGHSSHYNPCVIREAARAGVILFCLPPNTTHVAQPLDVAPFHSLKVYWNHVCDEYMSSHPGKTVTIYDFSWLFAAAWYQAMTPATIISGFRAAGVYPFSRRLIHISGAEVVATPTAKLAQKEGINYLPFYTPRRQHFHSPFPSPPTSPTFNHLTSSSTVNVSGSSVLLLVLLSYSFFPQVVEETVTEKDVQFTEEEHHRFQKRYEEAYDLPDERYSLWLKYYKYSTHMSSHMESSVISSPSSAPSVHPLVLSRDKENDPLWSEFLLVPSPAKNAHPGKARVLTSAAFLQELSEKEQKKKEAAEAKESRKREREEKKAQKLKEKEMKQMHRKKKQVDKLLSSDDDYCSK